MRSIKTLVLALGAFILFFVGSMLYNHFHTISPIFSNSLYDNLAKRCVNAYNDDTENKTVRLLVVDGGGIDGIIPLSVLSYLEEKTGKSTSDLFDFFIGTSTGAIIVSTLNIPGQNGHPKFTAKEVLEFYKTLSHSIMTASIARKIFTLNGLLAPRFSTENLYEQLTSRTGDKVLFGDLLNKVVITAYNLNEKHITLIRNWQCQFATYPLSSLLTAATAAPMFYSPTILRDIRTQDEAAYVDGAIFSNIPLLYGANEALKLYPKANKVIIVHLGTGGIVLNQLQLAGNTTESWGILEWAPALLSIFYKSQNTEVVEAIELLKQIAIKNKLDYSYYYFDKIYTLSGPFDASAENIEHLAETANSLIIEQKPKLDAVARKLSIEP